MMEVYVCTSCSFKAFTCHEKSVTRLTNLQFILYFINVSSVSLVAYTQTLPLLLFVQYLHRYEVKFRNINIGCQHFHVLILSF